MSHWLRNAKYEPISKAYPLILTLISFPLMYEWPYNYDSIKSWDVT